MHFITFKLQTSMHHDADIRIIFDNQNRSLLAGHIVPTLEVDIVDKIASAITDGISKFEPQTRELSILPSTDVWQRCDQLLDVFKGGDGFWRAIGNQRDIYADS